MTPKNSKKSIRTSSALLASALLAAPVVLVTSQDAAAQTPATVTTPAAGERGKSDTIKPNPPSKTSYLKQIDQCCIEIVGMDAKGNGVLKGSDGKEFSYGGSGEKIYLKAYIKDAGAVQSATTRQSNNYIKFAKFVANIEVVGINTNQQTVYKNKAGETFTLHPTTGDMVFIK